MALAITSGVIPSGQAFGCPLLNSEFLSWPSESGITLSLIPAQNTTFSVEYGTDPDELSLETDTREVLGGELFSVRLENLAPDT
ncbi:MAG: hypothetical protein KDD53_04500, partial [Bdellovibrionales bacterium]|nr:hypothetical protein [Bdellovibrionales bacterium]